ncbi:MAG: response regulator [Candidatus Paceibacterota bacterium]
MAHILLVDDEAEIHGRYGRLLTNAGHTVEHAENRQIALMFLGDGAGVDPDLPVEMVVCDNHMGSDHEGVALAEVLRNRGDMIPFILHTSDELKFVLAENRFDITAHKIEYCKKDRANPDKLVQCVELLLERISRAGL